MGWGVNGEWRHPEVTAVVSERDPERLREPGRAAGESAECPRRCGAGISLPPPAGHRVDTEEGLERPDEDAARSPRGARDGVETVVEAVGPEDVRDAAGPVEEPVAPRPEGRVRGAVLGTEVRLGLHDAPGRQRAPELGDEDAAEKVPGHGGGRSLVEAAGEHGTRADRSRARDSAGPASGYSSPPLTSTIAPWTTATAAHSRASARRVASPIRAPPPVTIATRPSNLMPAPSVAVAGLSPRGTALAR
jgi:hypothetical protein